MSKTIGRLGYLGVGLESTPGTAVSPSVYLPYTAISIRGHHEPLDVKGTTSSRFMDRSSVVGKKWSEGDISMDLDVVNSGYLWKMALGNEQLTTGTPNNHLFYVTASGNTPKTATMIFGRGDTDVEQYSYMAMNSLTLEVKESIATLKAAVKGNFPTVPSAQTPTVTSGTVFAFPTFSLGFGSNLTNAATAASSSATPVNEYNLTITNDVQLIFQTGQSTPTAIRTKSFKAAGGYTLFFENGTDRDAYYALQKRAMYISMTGNLNEQCRIRIPMFRLNEGEISTGIDDFFVIKTKFDVEDNVGAGGAIDTGVRMMDVLLQNGLSSTY